MTHASLFSGIGGPEMAAAWMGWDNLFHCEINPFGRRVLEYWFPKSKSYEDITKTSFKTWRGQVDVLTGGFPCQPFSYAGKRGGASDDRYLWPEMLRVIDEVRPSWVVGENVAGITTMVERASFFAMGGQTALFGEGDTYEEIRGLFTIERVCSDLERLGYSVQTVLVPACAVGAPHKRDRVFIVARRVEAVSEESMHGGQLHRPNEEQGSERNERHTCAGGGKRICGETSRTTSSDTACSREGTSRPSESIEGSRGDTHQQPSEWGAATERLDRLLAVLRHATDTEGETSERLRPRQSEVGRAQQEQSGGRGGEGGSERLAPHPDSHRGCGVDEHMESELADRAKPVSNGGQRNVADTSDIGAGQREQSECQECGKSSLFEFRERYGESLSADGGVCGQRWQYFPSVSPVHRGNDGLPFDVDRLTLSFGKWRTESIKAYGNAIVPQVMYEIFRAIEITENETKQRKYD